jgi:hypothetical protein
MDKRMDDIPEEKFTLRRESDAMRAKKIILCCMVLLMVLPFLLVWLTGAVSF